MRAGELLREGWRGIVSGGLRTVAFGALVVVAIGALCFLELRQAASLQRFRDEYAAAGGHVSVVSMQEASLPAARCEALGDWPGVVAAGGSRNTGIVEFVTAPGVLFQSAGLTTGALRVWSPGTHLSEPGFLAGPALAAELGVRAGSYAAIPDEVTAPIVGIANVSRRNPQAERWLIDIIPPTGDIDECWVEFTREAHRGGEAALAAWFAAEPGEPIVRPYLRAGEFVRDPVAEFADRPQRYGWLAVAALITGVFMLTAWFRRSELALYLALGVPRAQVGVIVAVEAAVLIVAAAAVGVVYAVALQMFFDGAIPVEHVRLGLRAGFSAALLALGVAPWMAIATVRGSLASLLKDR